MNKEYNKIISFILLITAFHLRVHSQTVTDYEGNVYPTVTIGNQTWMAENLKVTHYSDGTPIPDGESFTFYPREVALTGSDSSKYYFYYNNDTSYSNQYGCLYNWFAAVNGTIGSNSNPSGIQGVCPTGWHLPSKNEWEELDNYLDNNVYSKLIVGGNTGFNVVLGGYRHDFENEFNGLGILGSYITSNEFINAPGFIDLFELMGSSSSHRYRGHRKTTGYSVRCLKNPGTSSQDLIKQSEFKLYPNPCKDKVWIQLEEPERANVTVFSIEGKIMLEQNIVQGINRLVFEGVDKGIYFMKIRSEDFIKTQKIIIQE